MRDRPKVINSIIGVLSNNGCNVSDACNFANISRKTFYTWIAEDEEFKERYYEAKERMLDNVESALYKSALEGNSTACAIILNARGQMRGYGNNQAAETGDQGGRVLVLETPANPLLRGEEINYEEIESTNKNIKDE